jgi:hypothetical protein
MSRQETSVELSISLPLGAVANQLKRAESELRFLSAKTAAGMEQRGNRDALQPLAARLEQIHETLESIRALIVDIERDLLAKSAGAKTSRRDDRDD